jgi:hypothetical protein
MGNRSYLYVCAAPDAGDEVFAQIAEANNNFPKFWQVLLAQAEFAEPIRYQRVFGDANSDNLAVPLAQGIERLKRLLSTAPSIPGLLNALPQWPLYAEAIVLWLQDLAEAHPGAWISANMDQYLWLFEGPVEEAAVELREALAQSWQRLARAIDAGDGAGLWDVLKGESSYETHAGDWSYWVWEFRVRGHRPPLLQRSLRQRAAQRALS